ncbi:MAG TPA: NADH-quinone oxidoreductase subunit I, partial [Propionibacteriaceae bacterium]|nr:NADH-quinone oxidoreductase subunit I [Propionibacteriaceae bacterium]
MGFFDEWAGFGVTLRTMFRPTFTQGYPEKGKEKVTQPR